MDVQQVSRQTDSFVPVKTVAVWFALHRVQEIHTTRLQMSRGPQDVVGSNSLFTESCKNTTSCQHICFVLVVEFSGNVSSLQRGALTARRAFPNSCCAASTKLLCFLILKIYHYYFIIITFLSKQRWRDDVLDSECVYLSMETN